MKGKGTFNLGGKPTLSLQLMQVRLQEAGSRYDNLLLFSKCFLTPHQPCCAPGQPPLGCKDTECQKKKKIPLGGDAESHPDAAESQIDVFWGTGFAINLTETGVLHLLFKTTFL